MKCEYVRTCCAQDLQAGDSFYWECPSLRSDSGLVTVSSNHTLPVDPAGLRFTFPHDTMLQAKHERKGRISLNLPRQQEITVLRLVPETNDSPLFQEEAAPLEDESPTVVIESLTEEFNGLYDTIVQRNRPRMKIRRPQA